jgi:hypothetical protein
MWGNEMESQPFEEITHEMKNLHRSMKNIIEIVFASSPLLALSTHGWGWKSCHSSYLLRVSGDFIILIFLHLKMGKRFSSRLGTIAPKSSFS